MVAIGHRGGRGDSGCGGCVGRRHLAGSYKIQHIHQSQSYDWNAMASEIYLLNELSLDRAKKIVSPDFIPAYDWFIEHADTVGPRPWRGHKPANILVKMVAQAGIQKPAGQDYAISVTSTGYEGYSDRAVEDQGDGTWVFRYCEHSATYSDESKIPYNEYLHNCLQDGVPVGVFVKESASDYR